MLSSFWHWFAIIVTIISILACWWLLHWTKGISDNEGGEDADETGHVWDHDIRELNHPLPRWWLHLFNLTIVFALVYLVIYPGLGNIPGVLGWTQLQQWEDEVEAASEVQAQVFARFEEMTPEALMADAEAMDIGRRLFGNHCAMCHGSDGRGAVAFPNLTDDDWIWGGSHDQILTTLKNGRIAAMPPMGAGMDNIELTRLAFYVRSLSGHDVDAGEAAQGKQKFDMLCMACHGPDGKGNQALGAPNLTNDIWLYGGDTATIIETLTKGRNGNMPAFGESLSDERREILAAYVASLSQQGN